MRPLLAVAWQDSSVNLYKSVSVFLFVFNSETVIKTQGSSVPHNIYHKELAIQAFPLKTPSAILLAVDS
jgi:hypothetical protein